MYIVEYLILHPFGRNPDWQIDNTKTDREQGRHDKAEVQDVTDKGDEPYIYMSL